jgi:hypothetical protein
MMQFLRVRLGRPELAFAPTTSGRVPFSFPKPVEGVYALLESLFLSRDGSDLSLGDMQVSLTPLFNALQSRTDGQVQVDVRFTGSTGLGIVISPEQNSVEIGILVVGL